MENIQIARLLAETADLMEIAAEDPFRVRSYRNGASAVESSTERLEEVARDRERKLTEISGIGKSLADAIQEIVERGSFERRDKLLKNTRRPHLNCSKFRVSDPRASGCCSSITE